MVKANVWVTAGLVVMAAASQVRAQAPEEARRIVDCVQAAVKQAEGASEYSGYGAATNSMCVLGGWLATGESFHYSLPMEKGKGYLIVGAGDKDVKDLDLAVGDGDSVVSDTEDDNTPWVHVVAESTVNVTITVTNATGVGETEFCCVIILEQDGGAGSGKDLVKAVRGMAKQLDELEGVQTEKTSGAICLMGGLFGQGGELGIERTFLPGDYALVGWGDSNCADLDLGIYENGEAVLKDEEEDATPVVECEISEEVQATVQLTMHASTGNAWGVCVVLTGTE